MKISEAIFRVGPHGVVPNDDYKKFKSDAGETPSKQIEAEIRAAVDPTQWEIDFLYRDQKLERVWVSRAGDSDSDSNCSAVGFFERWAENKLSVHGKVIDKRNGWAKLFWRMGEKLAELEGREFALPKGRSQDAEKFIRGMNYFTGGASTAESYTGLIESIIKEMRTDSEEFENLDHYDQWLAKYTYENLDKWPSQDTLHELAHRYPITEPKTIYRGMNFREQDKYEAFMASIKDGVLKTGGITSWGSKADATEQFAITQPSYFLDRDTMRAHDEASKAREFVTGYRGIILRMTAQPGQAIDVNKSRLGHEDEIILLPGTYKVEIEREVKKYRDALDGGEYNIDDVIQAPDGQTKYHESFRDYVMHHHQGELSDASRAHLFQSRVEHLKSFDYQPTEVVFHERKPYKGMDREGTPTYVEIQYPSTFFAQAAEGIYLPQHTEQCRKWARVSIKKIIDYIRAHPDVIFRYSDNVRDIAKFAGVEAPFVEVMKAHIGRQHRNLEIEGRKLNDLDLKDWDMRTAIQRHGERVIEVLKQVRI